MSDAPNNVKWTPQQREAIVTAGLSLLVSAAAGSGKTSVLAERCAHLVCDARPPCGVDQLLVVTFTEAAAAQMKSRIGAALAARPGSRRLTKQLSLLERAQISTLHGFCARLLRQHFHVVGLDPAFTIMDGDEARLLRNEVVRDLFLDAYENDDEHDPAFQRFVDAYGDGNDAPLMAQAVATHAMLCSLADPVAWLSGARRRVEEALRVPLRESELGRELTQTLATKLDDLARRCEEAQGVVGARAGFEKYVSQLRDLSGVVGGWQAAFAGGDFDALAADVRGLALPKKPTVAKATAGWDAASEALESVRAAMKPAGGAKAAARGSLQELALFTTAEWVEGLRAIRPHLEVFLSLVEGFGRRYGAAKKAARGVDFSDLEVLALRALRDGTADLVPSAVARAYHKQFEHVLVDEYQDINEVQDAILHLVSRECLGADSDEAANLFCVGDVKQSIYRFRLAEPGRFLDRYARFESAGAGGRGAVIDLQSNFRSRAPLLETLNGVFAKFMTRRAADLEYDLKQRLNLGASYPDPGDDSFAGAPIELHLLPKGGRAEGDEAEDAAGEGEAELDRTEREAALVARRLKQMMGLEADEAGRIAHARVFDGGESGEGLRPMRYRDAVVLLRSMTYKADQYADLLRRNGIPAHHDSAQGYFTAIEVQDVLALLSLLDNGRQDVPLAATLRGPLAGISAPETAMARIRLAYPAGQDGSEGVPFHEAVGRYADERDDELAGRLRRFLARLREWRQLARQRPLDDVLWTIYDQAGYLAYYGGLDDGAQRVANLLDLHERARQFGTFARGGGLSRFLRLLDSLREEADLGRPSVLGEADDVVRIMSIHRAKGLEFPVVFLPDLGKRINLSDSAGPILIDRQYFVGMSVVDEAKRVRYPSLAGVLVGARLRQKSLAEELRVLYVAMTRAKEHLVLVGTCSEKAADAWHSVYGSHVGPLAAELVLSAGCMLDWLGPVAAALNGPMHHPPAGCPRESFRVVGHTPQEIASWKQEGRGRTAWTEAQRNLAVLVPLSPPPPQDAQASAIIDQLTCPYAHEAFTRMAAARAATEVARASRGAALATPRFALGGAALSAADAGAATHVVLQHLNFGRSCDAEDVARQVEEMVRRAVLSPSQAQAVDAAAIGWLVGTDLGRLIQCRADALRREVPFHLAVGESASDPADQQMIRGTIDLLIPPAEPGGGFVVVDYKTDRLGAEGIEARAAAHATQVTLYRDAVERITGAKVSAAYLVFLAARVVREVG